MVTYPTSPGINIIVGSTLQAPFFAGQMLANIDYVFSASGSVFYAQNEPPASNPPIILNASLPDGQAGVAYSNTMILQSGTGISPFVWSANGLPVGLSINPSTGIISGNISGSAQGFYSVVISVSDNFAGGRTTSRTYSLTVIQPPATYTAFGYGDNISDGRGVLAGLTYTASGIADTVSDGTAATSQSFLASALADCISDAVASFSATSETSGGGGNEFIPVVSQSRNLRGLISVSKSTAKIVVRVPDVQEFTLFVRLDGSPRGQATSGDSTSSIYK